jgi:hypothetical protein
MLPVMPDVLRTPDVLHIIAGSATWTPIAANDAGTSEKPALRRFQMLAYTGQAMRLPSWEHPVVVDLAGMRVSAKPRPILKDHKSSLVVGHTESVTIEAGQLMVNGVVSGAGAVAQEVVQAADNQFPWQASLAASVQRAVFIPAGKTAEANGREFAGPVFIARATRLGEVSFVALGADDDTAVAIAASATPSATQSTTQQEVLSMDFDTWIQAQGFALADLSDEQLTNLRQVHAALPPAQAGPLTTDDEGNDLNDAVQAYRAQIAAEESRVADIRRVCAGRHDQLQAQAISEGWDTTKTELAVLRAERPTAANIITSGDQPVASAVLEAAACLSTDLPEIEQHYDEQTLEAAHQRFRTGLGLGRLFVEAAAANGVYVREFRDDPQKVLRAAFSSMDLPGILSNVANKFLLAGFEGVESTWRALADIRSVRDFKRVTSYRLTGDFMYEEVGPDGELKHGKVGEESFGNQARTYGKMFSVTRQDFINDDMGALTVIPRRIGRGGALKLNMVFWKTFLDNAAFFSAGNKNLLSGAASALSIDALTQAEQVFLDQVDPDGNPLAITPAILLVPNGLNVQASTLMRSTEVRPGGQNARKVEMVTNPHAGKFMVQRSSYLSNANIPGHSTSAWYVLANPSEMPVIEVAFLNGQQTPIVESAEADFNTLGVQMRGYHDWGVEKQDHRGGVKSAGS